LKNAVFKISLASSVGLGKGHFEQKFCKGVALKEKTREEAQNDNAFWLVASIFKCNVPYSSKIYHDKCMQMTYKK
jgi:hypothetical protein